MDVATGLEDIGLTSLRLIVGRLIENPENGDLNIAMFNYFIGRLRLGYSMRLPTESF
jgi:hypothetical protein